MVTVGKLECTMYISQRSIKVIYLIFIKAIELELREKVSLCQSIEIICNPERYPCLFLQEYRASRVKLNCTRITEKTF